MKRASASDTMCRLGRLIVTQFATKHSGGERIHHVWEWTIKQGNAC